MRRVFFPQVRGKNLYFDQNDMAVRFEVLPRFGVPAALASHPAAPESTGPGRVMVAQVAPDEFLFMDANVSIDIRPAYGSDFNTAQYLRIEEGSRAFASRIMPSVNRSPSLPSLKSALPFTYTE
jgi:hypothetical protein